MQDSFGAVYEVTHIVDREIIGDFDAWLGRHIEEMLSIQGISRAASFTADDHDDGRPQRVSQYHFDSDTDLENYLAGPARTIRESTDNAFAGRYEVYRRVLHENEVIDGSLRPAETCLNCGTTLSGQYCGNCGQRATTRLISIWQLLREAFGDLLELDSRLWRTLIPLAIRPGKLTRDYLEGRRARFMPPFRTYLVLSIIFFLIAFFDPREEFGILLGPETATPEYSEEIRSNDSSQPAKNGAQLTGQTRPDLRDNAEVADVPLPDTDPSSIENGDSGEHVNRFRVRIGDGNSATDDSCDDIETGDLPPWLSSWLTPEQLKVMCQKLVADEGQAWGSKLLDNVPAALIALLPLMALVLKALYPLSKRYYVEHVLFVVHYHAFIFLILSLQIMFARLGTFFSLSEDIPTITAVAVSIYIPAYLFKAMRRVYEQRWPLTAVKYVVLILAYFVGLTGILGVTATIAAFSI